MFGHLSAVYVVISGHFLYTLEDSSTSWSTARVCPTSTNFEGTAFATHCYIHNTHHAGSLDEVMSSSPGLSKKITCCPLPYLGLLLHQEARRHQEEGRRWQSFDYLGRDESLPWTCRASGET